MVLNAWLYQNNMTSQNANIKVDNGKILTVSIDLPANGNPTAFGIFIHGFSSHDDLAAASNIRQSLLLEGLGIATFNIAEPSDNGFTFDFSSMVSDIELIANFMDEKYAAPEILVGHGLGGTLALLAVNQISSVKAIAIVGAPVSAAQIELLIKNAIGKANHTEQISARHNNIEHPLSETLAKINFAKVIKQLKRALLILHSPQDKVIDIENAAFIYQAARHPKSYISLNGADHFLAQAEDAQYAGNLIATWSKRYISSKPNPAMFTADQQVVTRTGEHGYVTEIRTDHHSMIADEPIRVGGTNLGPDPYELLLASLGACTGITLRMYANHKKWPVEEIRINLRHHRIYNEDCENCKENEKKLDKIERIIEIEGDLSDAQLERLLEIADRCPVHKTLSSKVRIDTSVKHP